MKSIAIITCEPFPNGMAATNRIISYAKELVKLQVQVSVFIMRPTCRDRNSSEVSNTFGGGFSPKNMIMWGIKLLLPLVIIQVIKEDFLELFVKFMRIIAIVSLFFFILTMIFPELGDLFIRYGVPSDIRNSVYATFFYSYPVPGLASSAFQIFNRNYGPCPEPGMYAFLLIIALIFNYFKYRKFINLTGILFLVCLMTTQSTAGYIALLFVFLYSIYLTRYRLLSWMFLVVILIGSYYVYQLPFMRGKIDTNIYVAESSRLDEARRGRGHQAVKSVGAFARNFAFGGGLTYESSLGLSEADLSGFSLLDIGRQSGIIGLFLYCLGIFSFLLYLQKRYLGASNMIGNVFLFASISIVLSSQQVLFFRTIMLTMVYYGLWYYPQLRVIAKKAPATLMLANKASIA